MIPVSTRGRVVCCAFLGSCDAATTGALPKRSALAIIGTFTVRVLDARTAELRGTLPAAPDTLWALAFAPVFIANLIFAQRFSDVETTTTAFAANLLGAMVGGALE